MRGKIVISQKAHISCPNCDGDSMYYVWTFPEGTRAVAEQWTLEMMRKRCIEYKEYCALCDYTSTR